MGAVNQLSNCVNSSENASNSETKRGDLVTEKTAKVIIELKKVCSERNLTPPEVYEIIDNNPEFGAISLSTIRRILKDGSENEGFRYSSIKPMVKALLDIREDDKLLDIPEQFDSEKSREYFAERQALREVVLLKSEQEKQLREQIKAAEEEKEREITRMSLQHDQNIDRLLTMHQSYDSKSEKTITILERENAFLHQNIIQLQEALSCERESKKRLYDDLKMYMQKTHELSASLADILKQDKSK